MKKEKAPILEDEFPLIQGSSVQRNRFTPEEDERIIALANKCLSRKMDVKLNLRDLARRLGRKNINACYNRYNYLLDKEEESNRARARAISNGEQIVRQTETLVSFFVPNESLGEVTSILKDLEYPFFIANKPVVN